MAITFDPEAKRRAIASIKRYFLEEQDLDLGELGAGSILAFFLEDLAPTVYNRAVADAQRYVQERALDLEGACHADEFAYWTSPERKGARRR